MKGTDNRRQHLQEMRFGATVAGTLLGACGLVIALFLAATFHHRWVEYRGVAVAAWLVMAVSTVPPLLAMPWVSFGPARQLLIIGWRLSVLLWALLLTDHWSSSQGNCFLSLLMACYFVCLPLESWLLIRYLRREA